MKTKLYELCNPSDPYTFYAPTVEVAGVAACLLSTGFGAVSIDGEERTPILFGWDEWLTEKGIDETWFKTHALEIADALDSFMIGDAARRADVDSMLELLPPEKRNQWVAERQERRRSSLNKIGERAYELAQKFRSEAC